MSPSIVITTTFIIIIFTILTVVLIRTPVDSPHASGPVLCAVLPFIPGSGRHFITLTMSFQEESAGVQVDSADGGGAGAQGSAEDPAQGALEPGLSSPSLSLATAVLTSGYIHADPKVKNPEPQKFSFYDADHKVLVLNGGTLIAVHKKTSTSPETFYVLASRLSSAGDKGNPVFLAVSGGKLCLYCEMDKKKGRPTLQLKKKDISQLPTSDTKDSKGFTFYRKKKGCWNTLESAAHQGWFISTCHSNEHVRMTDKPGRQELTDFTFMPVSKAHTSPSEVSE
ncbi:interleukin-37 [Myotis yumanensis]|uniref:interleukin-37 n=1 Tax=Myotis yumanensis TaxID=159337 RepID=UPI0038D36645